METTLDSMDGEKDVEDILDCLCGMNQRGEIADIIVITNDCEDNATLFTNLDRNDIIIGRLNIAVMNWWNMEIGAQGEDDDEAEVT